MAIYKAAFACIRYGFEKLNFSRIVGRAEVDNIASLKVLEKCGMKYIGTEWVDNHPVRTYELLNPLIR